MRISRYFALPTLIACAALLGACTTVQNGGGPPGTSSAGWGQIAAGTGTVIAESKIGPKADAKVAQAAEQLDKYCGALRTAAAIGGIFVPEKQRNIANMAQAGIDAVCEAPPRDTKAALVTAVKVYDAVQAARAVPAS